MKILLGLLILCLLKQSFTANVPSLDVTENYCAGGTYKIKNSTFNSFNSNPQNFTGSFDSPRKDSNYNLLIIILQISYDSTDGTIDYQAIEEVSKRSTTNFFFQISSSSFSNISIFTIKYLSIDSKFSLNSQYNKLSLLYDFGSNFVKKNYTSTQYIALNSSTIYYSVITNINGLTHYGSSTNYAYLNIRNSKIYNNSIKVQILYQPQTSIIHFDITILFVFFDSNQLFKQGFYLYQFYYLFSSSYFQFNQSSSKIYNNAVIFQSFYKLSTTITSYNFNILQNGTTFNIRLSDFSVLFFFYYQWQIFECLDSSFIFYSPDNRMCNDKCPDNYYVNIEKNICQRCLPASCITCTPTLNQCLSCNSQSYLNSSLCYQCSLIQINCLSCAFNIYFQCLTCIDNATTPNSYCRCKINQYLYIGNCTLCSSLDANCLQCISNSSNSTVQCTKCQSEMIPDGKSCQCSSNQYIFDTKCYLCSLHDANCIQCFRNPFFYCSVCLPNMTFIGFFCQCNQNFVLVDLKCQCHLQFVQKLCSKSICGNGIIGYNEKCDDNNTVNGDGCSNVCQIQIHYFCESNNVTNISRCELISFQAYLSWISKLPNANKVQFIIDITPNLNVWYKINWTQQVQFTINNTSFFPLQLSSSKIMNNNSILSIVQSSFDNSKCYLQVQYHENIEHVFFKGGFKSSSKLFNFGKTVFGMKYLQANNDLILNYYQPQIYSYRQIIDMASFVIDGLVAIFFVFGLFLQKMVCIQTIGIIQFASFTLLTQKSFSPTTAALNNLRYSSFLFQLTQKTQSFTSGQISKLGFRSNFFSSYNVTFLFFFCPFIVGLMLHIAAKKKILSYIDYYQKANFILGEISLYGLFFGSYLLFAVTQTSVYYNSSTFDIFCGFFFTIITLSYSFFPFFYKQAFIQLYPQIKYKFPYCILQMANRFLKITIMIATSQLIFGNFIVIFFLVFGFLIARKCDLNNNKLIKYQQIVNFVIQFLIQICFAVLKLAPNQEISLKIPFIIIILLFLALICGFVIIISSIIRLNSQKNIKQQQKCFQNSQRIVIPE